MPVPEVVEAWKREVNMRIEHGGDPLAVLFAVNDLAQESRKAGDLRFVNAFEANGVLVTQLAAALRNQPPAVRDMFRKVVEIWITRGIFSKRTLRDLRAELNLVEIAESAVQGNDNEDRQLAQDELKETLRSLETTAVRARAIDTFPLHKLLALQAWIAQRFASASETLQAAREAEAGRAREVLAMDINDVDADRVRSEREALAQTVGTVRELELAVDVHELVNAALVKALEKDVQRAENNLKAADEEMAQIPTAKAAVQALDALKDARGFVRTTYSYFRSVPKAKKVKERMEEVAPSISLFKVGDKRPKDDGAGQVFDKGKQAYVPLPSVDEEPAWRS